MKAHLLLPVAILGFTSLCSLQAQTPYTPNANTLLLYHFDEEKGIATAYDASGNDRNATRGNANSGGEASLPGMGYAHRPTTGLSARTYWTDPAAPTSPEAILYNLGSTSFTIEMWVKFDSLDFTSRNLVSIQSGTVVQPDFSISIYKPTTGSFAGGTYISVGDSAGSNRTGTFAGTPTSLTLAVDQWYHIAVSVTDTGNGNSTYRYYVNTPGSSITPTPTHVSTNTHMAPHTANTELRRLEIGNYYGSSGTAFIPGVIDELRISSGALTTFETLAAIPEPSHVALLASAAGMFLLGYTRRKRSS